MWEPRGVRSKRAPGWDLEEYIDIYLIFIQILMSSAVTFSYLTMSSRIFSAKQTMSSSLLMNNIGVLTWENNISQYYLDILTNYGELSTFGIQSIGLF